MREEPRTRGHIRSALGDLLKGGTTVTLHSTWTLHDLHVLEEESKVNG